MDDPFYLRVWGPFAADETDQYREHMYANLIVSHWQMDWDVGTLDEQHLREVAAVFFQGEIGLRFGAMCATSGSRPRAAAGRVAGSSASSIRSGGRPSCQGRPR
jgi:hypothetical protein